MVPERVDTITAPINEEVDSDNMFTLSELEDILHRLKDIAAGEDSVCYSMKNNAELPIGHISPISITNPLQKDILHNIKNGQGYTNSQERQTHPPISLLRDFSKEMERFVLARVWLMPS